jgi:cytochrome oxidase Cu insertion factor (SCO1/SenC/PrrC family)
MVDHSATTFVIDAEGRLRLAISFGTPVADIRHDLQLLLPR